MIDQEDVVRLMPGVQVHVLDDENGFVETPGDVRRLQGSGLRMLAGELLPRLDGVARGADIVADLAPRLPAAEVLALLDGLRGQGLLAAGPAPEPQPAGSFAVLGPEPLAGQLVAALKQTAGNEVAGLGEPADIAGVSADLVIVAVASLFDPWAARLNEQLVRAEQPCLFYGVAPGGAGFAGPLWTSTRSAACYACLRTRIFSNSTNGPTWRAYARFLADSGKRAVQHEPPPWAAAKLAGAVARRALGWRARPGEDALDELLWFDGDAMVEARRHLLVVPTCAACGGGGRLDRPAAELRDAEDPVVGIVHATSVRRAESGPPIYLSGSTSADFSLIKKPMRVTRNGGAGFTKKDAINATVGESLERYAAGIYRQDSLRLACWRELDAAGERAVQPGAFGLFSAEQYASADFPFAPFTADTPVRWVAARRWPAIGPADEQPCHWVPASQVYLHYRRAVGEAAIGPSISTGLAAGPSLVEAVLGGVCEILERDALAISWLHRLPPRPVPDEVIKASSSVAYHLEAANSWRVRFYDLSLDLAPPVVVAVMDHRTGCEHVMSFGSACRLSPVRAVEKAFLEAAQGLTYVRRLLKQYQDWQAAPDFSNVDDFNQHAILYTRHPELRERAGYLVHPTEPAACTRPGRMAMAEIDADPAETLHLITEELTAAGYPIYVVDLTTPDVAHLGTRVVRVLVPGMQHLSGVHRLRLLGSPRLRDVVSRLGVVSAPDNPYPHPLP